MALSWSTIEELFNIPRERTDEGDSDYDSSYSEESIQPFEERLKKLNSNVSEIGSTPQLKISPVEEVKSITQDEQETQPKPESPKKAKISEEKEKPELVVDISDQNSDDQNSDDQKYQSISRSESNLLEEDESEDSSGTALNYVEDSVEKVENKKIENMSKDSFEENVDTRPELLSRGRRLVNDGQLWLLDHPDKKFAKFYAEKEYLLTEFLKGGELPFDEYRKEMENASVDTNIPVFDPDEIRARMSEVSTWRDRIKYIQLKVNQQFFLFEKHKDLLEGLLTQSLYERSKQNGNVYLHLNDIYLYYASLRELKDSAKIVVDNLDSAYNTLSRQASVMQPDNEKERVFKEPKPISSEQKMFDGISSGKQKIIPKTERIPVNKSSVTPPKPKISITEKVEF